MSAVSENSSTLLEISHIAKQSIIGLRLRMIALYSQIPKFTSESEIRPKMTYLFKNLTNTSGSGEEIYTGMPKLLNRVIFGTPCSVFQAVPAIFQVIFFRKIEIFFSHLSRRSRSFVILNLAAGIQFEHNFYQISCYFIGSFISFAFYLS